MMGIAGLLAVIFDLDGTLVQTERLKAISYARTTVELCPYTTNEGRVLEAHKDVVGLPRRDVASALVERFDLKEKARARMDEFGVTAPWQAFVQVRLGYYEEMISDSEILRTQRIHDQGLLEDRWIVDDPDVLPDLVRQLIETSR